MIKLKKIFFKEINEKIISQSLNYFNVNDFDNSISKILIIQFLNYIKKTMN